MILQYKGFNNNWVYEEADTITSAVVWVGKVTHDYRKDGVKYEQKQKLNQDNLTYMNELSKAIDKLIIEETHCNEEIVYHINKPFEEMENVVVITLNDRNKGVTRVFEEGVYLLNDKGQTVQRLV